MRILHVGWGFTPWRRGGLIEYAEDVMAAQTRRGHEVAYFCSGRHYPRLSGPRLKRRRRDGVTIYEVINAPIPSGFELGTRTPERDLAEPRTEALFRRALERFAPDLVHIQELLSLPSSLIDIAREAGVPTVMTLQDYFPLCATLRLVDAEGVICTRLEVGEDCVTRNAEAPANNEPYVWETIHYEIRRWYGRLRVGRLISEERYDWLVRKVVDWAIADLPKAWPDDGPRARLEPGLAPAYQRRRDLNVERLSRVDRLVPQSRRVGEIYAARGVTTDRMTHAPFTLQHIEHLRPRALERPPSPVTFVTLGGCASRTKGSLVIRDAMRALEPSGFRLVVAGGVEDEVREELEAHPCVELHGLYAPHELDALLDRADVGIVSSTWEEALGYVGLEMLAKGLPLIANPLGGIVEYAREGETAWLNEPCTGAGLAELMEALIADPARVLDLHRRVVAMRDSLITPMATHLDALESIYREAQSSSVR
jgi:glycosyltransferase involved in cell wall biosynthesis